MSKSTCCIQMDNFSVTSKANILVAVYLVFCLQNKKKSWYDLKTFYTWQQL